MADDKELKFIFARKERYTTNNYKIYKGNDANVITYHKFGQKIIPEMCNKLTDSDYGAHHMKASFVGNSTRKNKKYKVFRYTKSGNMILVKSIYTKVPNDLTKHSSMPNVTIMNQDLNILKPVHSSKIYQNPNNYFNTDFIVNNCCKTCNKTECNNPFLNPLIAAKIMRCQLGGKEESCCCSCNSDAMFEVMKSLYNCYKKKNCTNCTCILCGNICVSDLLKGEGQKSVSVSIGEQRVKEKIEKAKAEGLLTPLAGKTHEQKEKIVKGLAKAGLPLPEAKTASEKKLVNKVRKEMGLPPEPKTPEERVKFDKAHTAGIITPLKGKTQAQKEKAIQKMLEAGVVPPEGRTPSEKALINKLKTEFPAPKITPKQAGIITPLEGKTPAEQEKALRKMAAAGLPLPEGRSASEKALINKIATSVVKIPSEKLRKAKAEGLLTPLKGKSDKEKEKIIKGLAKAGLPLPEPQTASEAKLMNKIRKEIGLPPNPKTPEERKNMEKAMAAGVITPLEGKTPAKKEQILRKINEAGIPLPEGRTASEKALIDKIKATPKHIPKKLPAKLQEAKAKGLITPLEGKNRNQKENILRGLAMLGLPLPEGKSESDKKLADKVRKDLGVSPVPKTELEKKRLDKAYAQGNVLPLEGKSPADKEKILRKLAVDGIKLPEGRTPSEKALIDKIMAEMGALPPSVPSENIQKAKTLGLLTPLEGKPREQKEKILRGLAKLGIPLPEAKTTSDKKIADKVRKEMGLPPEPKTSSEKTRLENAYAKGIITPLEEKSKADKEKALTKMAEAGVTLPEGRTPSEKALINKIKAQVEPRASDKFQKPKAESLASPLKGKTRAQKEKILRDLAMRGLPLPEGKTESDRKLADKVRRDLGVSPAPKTELEKKRIDKAYAQGNVLPLEGKTNAEKEIVLRKLAKEGVPLPKGRTPSEKALIDKIMGELGALPVSIPSEKLRKANAEGLLTPLEGKSPEQREKILRGLAKLGIPLPEAKTNSDRKITNKVRRDMGLPPEPTTESEKKRLAKAYAQGLISPLEGKPHADKAKTLRKIAAAGVKLPEGRTPSEKALVKEIMDEMGALLSAISIPSEKLRKAKEEGLLTPLQGKSNAQKEKIMKSLAKLGLPLPEVKTASEKKLANKVRQEMGLPVEPKNELEKKQLAKAYAEGIITPLEGKTDNEKENILKKMAVNGVPLPEGRTSSEKALIDKIKGKIPAKSSVIKVPSDKLRKAKAEGLITPLEGKTKGQKEKILRGLAMLGLPLPEGKTASDKKLIDKVRKDLGVSPAPKTEAEKKRLDKAYTQGIVLPLEGKSSADKEKILRKLAKAGVHLPKGRTPTENALIDKIKAEMGALLSAISIPSDKLRKAKDEGLLTPLKGKSNVEKEKIMRKLAKLGMPLPETKTESEKKLADKVRHKMGLPVEPKNELEKKQLAKAYAKGIITPLEGKNKSDKEKILRKMAEVGVPLPEGRTPSEKVLLSKIKAQVPSRTSTLRVPSEKLRKAKAEGLLSPMEGKSRAQKEKILRGLAMLGLPLPEGRTISDRKLADKVRKDLGVTPAPKTHEEKRKIAQAYAQGIVSPLEGKSYADKEKVLRKLAETGVPLPVGRTPSENALIEKILAEMGALMSATNIPSDKLRRAKAEGLLTPLEGKPPEKREKILRGLAKLGMPLPEAKTVSDKKIADKVRKEMGLPPVPKSESERRRLAKGYNLGIITPLEGKSNADKEKALRHMAKAGVPLPDGRTASEKKMISKIKDEIDKQPPVTKSPSDKLRHAKKAGLLTPLQGKSPDQKEKIIKGLAKAGLPLPEGKTASERKLIKKVVKDLGLPSAPRSPQEKDKWVKALSDGIITPLEGKTDSQKEKILKNILEAGLPLPEGKTVSDRALIAKIKKTTGAPTFIPSDKIKKARAAGLLTPLEGKSPKQKEKILRGLAQAGLPLPEGKTASEKALINQIKTELGLPPEGTTSSERAVIKRAAAEGLFTPLAGKTSAQKEKILKGLLDAGLPVPEGKTASEKDLIKKLRTDANLPLQPTPSEKLGMARKKPKGTKAKDLGVEKVKGGISEKFEEVVKTTKCDRACGCDKKKIRFKHSYVKIEITSPDLSSCCPCPDECLPGVKGGVFVDNEGIKVTVGRATGAPTYTPSSASARTERSEFISFDHGDDNTSSFLSDEDWDSINDGMLEEIYAYYTSIYTKNTRYHNESDTSLVQRKCIHSSKRARVSNHSFICPNSRSRVNLSSKSNNSVPNNLEFASYLFNSASKSTGSVIIFKSVSSLSTINNNAEIINKSISSDYYRLGSEYALEVIDSDDSLNNDSEASYWTIGILLSDHRLCHKTKKRRNKVFDQHKSYNNDQVVILRFSEQNQEKVETIDVATTDAKYKSNLMKLVSDIIAQKPLSTNSSVFLLVPSNQSSVNMPPIKRHTSESISVTVQQKKKKNKKSNTTKSSTKSRMHVTSNANKDKCMLGLRIIPGGMKTKSPYLKKDLSDPGIGDRSEKKSKTRPGTCTVAVSTHNSKAKDLLSNNKTVMTEIDSACTILYEHESNIRDVNVQNQNNHNKKCNSSCSQGAKETGLKKCNMTCTRGIGKDRETQCTSSCHLSCSGTQTDCAQHDKMCSTRSSHNNRPCETQIDIGKVDTCCDETCNCGIKADPTCSLKPCVPECSQDVSISTKIKENSSSRSKYIEKIYERSKENRKCGPDTPLNFTNNEKQCSLPKCDQDCGQDLPLTLKIEANILGKDVVEDCCCHNKENMTELGDTFDSGKDTKTRGYTGIKAKMLKKKNKLFERGDAYCNQKKSGNEVQLDTECKNKVQSDIKDTKRQSEEFLCNQKDKNTLKCSDQALKDKNRKDSGCNPVSNENKDNSGQGLDQTLNNLQKSVGSICEQTRKLLESLNFQNKTACDLNCIGCSGFQQREQQMRQLNNPTVSKKESDLSDYIYTTDDVDWAKEIFFKSGLTQQASAGFKVKMRKKVDRVRSEDLSYLALYYDLYGSGSDQESAGEQFSKDGSHSDAETLDTNHKTCTCESKKDFELSLQDCPCKKNGGICTCHGSVTENNAGKKKNETDKRKNDNKTVGKNGQSLIDCECPPSMEESKAGMTAKTSAFEGLKLNLHGKGSKSPGLKGICCFDLYENDNKKSGSESSASSTYLIYT